jgi:hypothetical protein
MRSQLWIHPAAPGFGHSRQPRNGYAPVAVWRCDRERPLQGVQARGPCAGQGCVKGWSDATTCCNSSTGTPPQPCRWIPQAAGYPRHALSMSDNSTATARQRAPALPGGEKRSAGVKASGHASQPSATGSDSRPTRRALASTLPSGVTTWWRQSRSLRTSALTCA